jgi:hypothetical protein
MIRRLRWWWFVGLGWMALYVLIVAPLWGVPAFKRWVWSRPSVFAGVLGLFLAAVAWLVVIAPMLESGVDRFSERRPPRHRARLCRAFAWAPTGIFALLIVQFAVVRLRDIEDFGWYGPRYGGAIVVALLLSLFYARMMSRHLRNRVRAAAGRAGLCFWCGYPVAYLTGDRCPECGGVWSGGG